MHPIAALGGGLVVLFFVIVTVEVLAPILRHEYALWGLRSLLAELKHPAGTTEVADASAVGLLSGNGNHCDFAAYQVRSSLLGWEEVKKAYEARVPGAELVLCLVRDGRVIQSIPEDTSFDGVEVSMSGVGRGYVVGLRWYGQSAEGDVRCQ